MPLLHFLRLTLLLSLSTLGVNSAADDDGTWTYSLSGDEATITGCISTCPTGLIIPSTVDGYSVTSIGENAFRDNQLTSATIPNSVVAIGTAAFRFNQLTTVIISHSVASIGIDAFSNNQLTSVTIRYGVTSLGNAAFANNQLTSLTIPDSLTSLSNAAFTNNQLTSVTIPDTVTAIDENVFANNQLRSVTIPDGVISVGNDAFRNNPFINVLFLGDRPNLIGSLGSVATISYCTGKLGWPGTVIDGVPPVADCDADGTKDDLDAFPLDPQEDTDSNGNGIGDNEDGSALEALLSSARELGRNQVISAPSLYGLLTAEELETATSDLVKAIIDSPTAYGIDVGFDLDGDDQSKPLTDGLLLIRYLFGFSGDSLISGAIGDGAERDTAEEVESYIQERVPVQ